MKRVMIRYNKPYRVVVNPRDDEVELINEEDGEIGSVCKPALEDRDFLTIYILERGNGNEYCRTHYVGSERDC